MHEKKLTIPDVVQRKQSGPPLAMITAYDYVWARLADQSGLDLILVGDSLGMVMLGYEGTTRVTMEEMIHHSQAVVRGVQRALVVVDMPFGSYNVSPEQAIANAVRLVKEGGAEAVKIEGGVGMATIARALVEAGIPVMGHVGLTPQTAVKLGGFKVQGRDAKAAEELVASALAMEAAGCFSVLMEAVPAPVAKIITAGLKVPTIGIGAGGDCDGQVLVLHDLLGLYDRFVPKFARQYAQLGEAAMAAMRNYVAEVADRSFPGPENSFTMKPEELALLQQSLAKGQTEDA